LGRPLREIGERRVIEIILECLEVMPGMPIPFGDDVSAVNLLAVLKADMLVGETDVPPGMSLRQAARKAVVMNVSDLAAKGVQPIAILASIGLPSNLREEEVRQIGMGLNDGAREYGAYIIGGDTNEASDLVISCMAFGVAPKDQLIKRDGAKPGDILAVTGLFGKTSAGLKILLERLPAPQRIRRPLIDSVLNPKARLREGLALADTRAASSSIDSSDGLAQCLHEIARASGVGFLVDRLPIAPEAMEFAQLHDLDPIDLCLYGGEEYELVVTIRPGLWEIARRAVEGVGSQLIRIGVVREGRDILLRLGDEIVPIQARGWEHFKPPRL